MIDTKRLSQDSRHPMQAGKATPTKRVGRRGRVSAEGLRHCEPQWFFKDGMTPTAAVDQPFRRAEAIFANYTFG